LRPRNTSITEIERLYRQHGPALLLFAKAITGERSRAQDAIHQAYLFACVRNAALNDARVRGRNIELANEKLAWFEPPLRDYSEEANLRHALAELPDDQRQVTVLHIWGELTFAQIADLLDISVNTAASRYRYALARLRESMCAKENPCADPR
jgi:DNA-directed RNA polymerase specialized sigma24 family protein